MKIEDQVGHSWRLAKMRTIFSTPIPFPWSEKVKFANFNPKEKDKR
jgi:hypothetical protein